MKKTIYILAVIVISLSTTSCFKTGIQKSHQEKVSILLQPAKDVSIEDYPHENYSNRNWRKSPSISAIAWTAEGTPLVTRTMIYFNLKDIPARAIIVDAKLSLFAYDAPSQGTGHSTLSGSNTCLLQRIVSRWNEKKVTWNTQPTTTIENQVTIPASMNDMQDYKDIDITRLIQDIRKQKSKNFGFMLKLKNEEFYRRMIFASSDVPDENKKPTLTITYML